MRSRTAMWLLCKIKYEKTTEEGTEKKVTEQFIVNALSFTEAEANITNEMSSYISGQFEVADLSICPFKEIFFSDNNLDDKWYKAKLQFITIDEKTEKEKRSTVNYLVQASSINGAIKNIDEVMKNTMIDYVSCSVQETQILDVYEILPEKDV